MGLKIDEVFPIQYSINDVANGNPEVVVGVINEFVDEPLSMDEIIDLSTED